MKKKVLIIDDDDAICESVAMVLIEEGYDTCIGKNTKEALNAFKNHKPDIILLDYWLSGENGLELLVELRKIDGVTPVIMFSANTQAKEIIKNKDIQGYVEKPFTIAELLTSLNEVSN